MLPKFQKNIRNRCVANKEDEMERVYNFIKITLLGLIVGVLIILLLQINFWGDDIKMILRKSVPYQNKENRKELLEKNTEKPPSVILPPGPKYKI
jgi:hypothetical protein